jgi:hypothetical protein
VVNQRGKINWKINISNQTKLLTQQMLLSMFKKNENKTKVQDIR